METAIIISAILFCALMLFQIKENTKFTAERSWEITQILYNIYEPKRLENEKEFSKLLDEVTEEGTTKDESELSEEFYEKCQNLAKTIPLKLHNIRTEDIEKRNNYTKSEMERMGITIDKMQEVFKKYQNKRKLPHGK